MAENSSCASASSCSRGSCEGCPSHEATKAGVRNTSFLEAPNPNSNIKHVIGVVSGKGGVGKSMVTSSLAGVMARAGYKVGILDADITGPSIPKMFGVHGPAAASAEGMMLPEVAEDGTKIMSINLILDDEESPVVWRGPVIAGVVKQFWTDVVWGDIDYLFVDMPPGTGDVPLTCFQSLPVDGIVIVTSPQELVQMIVKKAYNMADMMHIPVVGLVENYSYIKCPDCGKKIEIFGESHIDEVAAELSLPVLGKMPMDKALASAADAGRIFDLENEYLADAKSILENVEKTV
ncbi:Chromosome partitioning ATPase, Mrp family, contains Fe-S cluster [Pseudobutyrivibrio sp. ACV-2]|uniref:Mrp/NBP35 family ATP-binding protein n=1 Tax=Pseudobutyrivibrio sp. ACV-2 TaxID=1520801 RepID=UPI0008950520|nr:Mrp/NBP35 family ATP-binding protein [Pseudobutyrivibrio sp. ACV-2]SEA30527.1 Chromosome partitioning ATPase, Mrp family, contains Fe-S cluster [Pseudobutyrivibrio sp. ACV-2]